MAQTDLNLASLPPRLRVIWKRMHDEFERISLNIFKEEDSSEQADFRHDIGFLAMTITKLLRLNWKDNYTVLLNPDNITGQAEAIWEQAIDRMQSIRESTGKESNQDKLLAGMCHRIIVAVWLYKRGNCSMFKILDVILSNELRSKETAKKYPDSCGLMFPILEEFHAEVIRLRLRETISSQPLQLPYR